MGYGVIQVDKLEGQRRDEEEAKERSKDKKRQKKMMQENLPQVPSESSLKACRRRKDEGQTDPQMLWLCMSVCCWSRS